MTELLNTHWEWMTTGNWDHLHYIADNTIRDKYNETGEPQPGRAICGLDATWSIPGIFSRFDCPRCAHCCRALGIPRGDGTPVNETAHP